MPLYDYECALCGKKFEKNRKISERDDPLNCVNSECYNKNVKRVVSKASVHYNGYKNNDY